MLWAAENPVMTVTQSGLPDSADTFSKYDVSDPSLVCQIFNAPAHVWYIMTFPLLPTFGVQTLPQWRNMHIYACSLSIITSRRQSSLSMIASRPTGTREGQKRPVPCHRDLCVCVCVRVCVCACAKCKKIQSW